MKTKGKIFLIIVFAIVAPMLLSMAIAENNQQRWWQRKRAKQPPKEFSTFTDEKGFTLQIKFSAGRRHNHPLMAFWIEDTSGVYIQSLYVAESIAKGYFGHGDASTGRWQPGPLRRPAALPYWGHQRGIQALDGYFVPSQDTPMPDAVSGPTPKSDFILTTTTKQKDPVVFNVLMEINQSWDWNQHWHNNKFPDDPHYKTSSQPALVYKARIDTRVPGYDVELKPIGHSHWSGATGELFPDLNTITTALEIANRVTVQLKQNP